MLQLGSPGLERCWKGKPFYRRCENAFSKLALSVGGFKDHAPPEHVARKITDLVRLPATVRKGEACLALPGLVVEPEESCVRPA